MNQKDKQISTSEKNHRWARPGRASHAWCTAFVMLTMLPSPGGAAGPVVGVSNPHGDPTQCMRCHRSVEKVVEIHAFEGDVVSLCCDCHDGRRATREAHPVSMVPSAEILARLPEGFPLTRGRLTCLTCHDVTGQCTPSPGAELPRRLLRMPQGGRVAFCANCHESEASRRFNVHKQMQAGQPIRETCLWCHFDGIVARSSRRDPSSPADLRMPSFGVCYSCHLIPKGHPLGHEHMYAVPSAEMKVHMVAVEMQSGMHLPFEKLLQYARASQRAPRVIPLDEQGRITCYTCHDPHEAGVVGPRPSSEGASALQERSSRLRAQEGSLCLSCHLR